MSGVTLTMQIHGVDHEEIDHAMARALEARGYTVFAPNERPTVAATGVRWETPSELAARLGLHRGSVCRSLAREDRPSPRWYDRGPTGRLARLVSTPELDAWLTRHVDVRQCQLCGRIADTVDAGHGVEYCAPCAEAEGVAAGGQEERRSSTP